MISIALAVLLTIVPTDPPAVDNGFPVAVTAVRLSGAAGGARTISRIAAGHSARARGAQQIVSFELESCPSEARAAVSADPAARSACWRALQRSSPALTAAPAAARADLQLVFLGTALEPAALTKAAASVLPELVAIVIEGGALSAEVERALERLAMGSPAAQLRQVPRTRRPELLTVLARHEDGRAFGLLVRAALESSIDTERGAAARALADYPEDGVQRLSNALEDSSPMVRRHAAEALRSQDARADVSLVTALLAMGVTARDGTSTAALADALIGAHEHQIAARTRKLEEEARAAIDRADLAAASQALAQLADTDREAYAAARPLRAERHLVAATLALDTPGQIEERGRTAAGELASAHGLDPKIEGLEAIALRLGRFLIAEGYPASAARVLGPYEERDGRVAALRDRALRDEVRRRVEAGDDAGAQARLRQLVQEGQSDLANELDDQYGIRSSGMWLAPASVGLFLCSFIGVAVRRERRRRRFEFRLIETEYARGEFHEGPYR